jgi:hypothetical protein
MDEQPQNFCLDRSLNIKTGDFISTKSLATGGEHRVTPSFHSETPRPVEETGCKKAGKGFGVQLMPLPKRLVRDPIEISFLDSALTIDRHRYPAICSEAMEVCE